jgi:ABC-type nitrate/sulfonate/bicarbonate transport system permease component
VATIVFGTVWPILLNTIDGAALPKILTGFRLSLSLALIPELI